MFCGSRVRVEVLTQYNENESSGTILRTEFHNPVKLSVLSIWGLLLSAYSSLGILGWFVGLTERTEQIRRGTYPRNPHSPAGTTETSGEWSEDVGGSGWTKQIGPCHR